MDGFHSAGNRVLDEWVESHRFVLRDLAVDATLSAAEAAGQMRGAEAAQPFLNRLVEIDPYSDASAARAARLLERLGAPAAAQQTYKSYVHRLQTVLGLDGISGFAGPRFGQSVGSFFRLDPDDEDQIRRTIDRWYELARQQRWAEAVSIGTKDAVIHPPNEPAVYGLDAIRDWYERRPRAKRITHAVTNIFGFERTAWVLHEVSITVETPNQGDLTMNAKAATALLRAPDGGWLFFFSTWSPIDSGQLCNRGPPIASEPIGSTP